MPIPDKILFLNTPETDYLQDLSYSGLVKALGPGRVVDHPWNPRFHLPLKDYPRDLGRAGFAWPRIRADAGSFGLVMVGAAKPRCFQSYLKIVDRIPPSTPVAFIDGGDWPEMGGDLKRLDGWELYLEAVKRRPFDLVLKREMAEGAAYPANTFPLPLSFNFDRLPGRLPSCLRYQVSFWAVESNPVRTKALALIEDEFDCRANGTVRDQVFSKYKRKGRRYLEELAACAVVLNFPGAGWDTLRYWEVPALGRFMISMRPRIAIPDNFVDGKEIVFCRDDLSDLVDLCQYSLDHPEQREVMARAGTAKAREKHSDVARARYMLEIVSKLLYPIS
jgi:hypothetical protein